MNPPAFAKNPPELEWFSGPPPSIGWYPASISQNWELLRYWDGSVWSWAVNYQASPQEVAAGLKREAQSGTGFIKWAFPWWVA